MMMKLEVFDPAMCCSTGVCGPSIDEVLARFAGDLQWLGDQGVTVTRFNLAQDPGAFVDSEPARVAMAEHGEQALPLIVLDGQPVSHGAYPDRETLAAWANLSSPLATVSPPTESREGGCCGGGSC